MKAKEYLEQLRKLDCIIANKLAEQSEYNYLAKELGEEIESLNLNQYIREQQEIITTLEQLPIKSYLVLYKYYHENKVLREIAEELNVSLSCVRDRKGAGMSALQELLDERNGKN